MEIKSKSVLDDRLVVEEGFPLGKGIRPRVLEVISACPQCGASIFGHDAVDQRAFEARRKGDFVKAKELGLVIEYSCDCRLREPAK